MTLLTATSTLIDAVKTYAPEEDAHIQRAVKRMEKRLLVLQVRAKKNEKRIRTLAFWCAMVTFNGGVSPGPRLAVIPCKGCEYLITFKDFIKNGEWDGRGNFKSLICPHCECLMEAGK
ncbi:MAG TPA: hypothetical protein VG347_05875 [Verrucomicrobiae bacterium]|nr:hypothetical protein [Verrucomicrobiae bacterium]